MEEYITKTAAMRAIGNHKCDYLNSCYEQDLFAIANLPAEDVIPIIHGRWKSDTKFPDCIYARCNKCNTVQIFYYGKSFTKYCPECGAKMDL